MFKSFFERFPEVYCVCWTQYSPYFNDGEPCRFGVNESSVVFLDQLDDDFECLADIFPGDDGYTRWNLDTSYEPIGRVLCLEGRDGGSNPPVSIK